MKKDQLAYSNCSIKQELELVQSVASIIPKILGSFCSLPENYFNEADSIRFGRRMNADRTLICVKRSNGSTLLAIKSNLSL